MIGDMAQLIDGFGRKVDYLRVSVIDRCNLRCCYCMPAEGVPLVPKAQILTFEEIVRFVQVAVSLGIRKVRVTGGEPLVRRDLPTLIRALSAVDGVRDLSLTTNGILLGEQAAALRDAGLQRLNVSLDSLRPEVFAELTRRDVLSRVLGGLEAAAGAGFAPIKVNVVVLRGVNQDEILDFALLSKRFPYSVRFLEYMPLDGYGNWDRRKLVSGREIVATLAEVGELVPIAPTDPSDVARRFRYADAVGEVGVISPVTEPFCSSCSRLRLTAEGFVKNCLFGREEWNIRDLLRAGASDEDLAAVIRIAVARKHAAFGGLDLDSERSARSMSQIGG